MIVGNLLDNAAKYTEPGGRVTVSVEAADAKAVLRVQDTGIGIAPEVLPFVFDAFMREGVPAGRPIKGSGVGLVLVRTLVELHEGRVGASSAGRGRGSQFVVRLPALDLQKMRSNLSTGGMNNPSHETAPTQFIGADGQIKTALRG